MHLLNPHYHRQGVTQGQFLSGVELVRILLDYLPNQD